jgi:hypothetical protein
VCIPNLRHSFTFHIKYNETLEDFTVVDIYILILRLGRFCDSSKSSSVVWWIACLPLDPMFMVQTRPRAIKVYGTTSFVGEVKLLVPCHEILQHVKDPFKVWTKIVCKALPVPPALLQDDCGSSIARELWWNQEFSLVSIISLLFSTLIYHLGDEQ